MTAGNPSWQGSARDSDSGGVLLEDLALASAEPIRKAPVVYTPGPQPWKLRQESKLEIVTERRIGYQVVDHFEPLELHEVLAD